MQRPGRLPGYLFNGFLVIKELGIKVKMDDASNVTYTIGGTPNGSSANADGMVSWATLQLSSAVTASDKCRLLGYELDQGLGNGSQPVPGSNQVKIGNYYYGFSGVYQPCGDSGIDALRSKIVNTELVRGAISQE